MTKWLIIDGYNLIHRSGDLPPGWLPRDLFGRRRRLIQLMEKTVGVLAERITVVFDGRSGGLPAEQESTAIEVLFSSRDKTADTVIEQLVFQAGPAGGVVVVTSDRLERETTEAAGAATMACSVFLDQLKETLERIEREFGQRSGKTAPPPSLGDLFSNFGKPSE